MFYSIPYQKILLRFSAIFLCAALLSVLLPTTPCTAHDRHSASEQAIKAAFIYNFTKFVSWPSQSFPSSTGSFTICVAGEPAMLSTLSETVRGKQAGGRAIEIVPLRDPKDASACQILFVSRHIPETQNRLLTAAKGKPVLTVGEEKDFTRRGGIINFYIANDRVQFEINTDNVRRSGLDISSRLLSLARIVKEGQP